MGSDKWDYVLQQAYQAGIIALVVGIVARVLGFAIQWVWVRLFPEYYGLKQAKEAAVQPQSEPIETKARTEQAPTTHPLVRAILADQQRRTTFDGRRAVYSLRDGEVEVIRKLFGSVVVLNGSQWTLGFVWRSDGSWWTEFFVGQTDPWFWSPIAEMVRDAELQSE